MLGKAEQRWNMCIGLGSVNCWRTQRTRKNCKCASDHSDEGQVAKIVFLFFFHSFISFQQVEPSSDFFLFRPFYDNLVVVFCIEVVGFLLEIGFGRFIRRMCG